MPNNIIANSAQDAPTTGIMGGLELSAPLVSGLGTSSIDINPSRLQEGTLGPGSLNFSLATSAGKHYVVVAEVWVDDGAAGPLVFSKGLRTVWHQTGGSAAKGPEATLYDNAAPNWTWVSTASGSNMRYTLANSSGTSRTYQVRWKVESTDKP